MNRLTNIVSRLYAFGFFPEESYSKHIIEGFDPGSE